MSHLKGVKDENVDVEDSTSLQQLFAENEAVGGEPTQTSAGAEAPAGAANPEAPSQDDLRRSVRRKTLTERGQAHKLEQCRKSFSSKLSTLLKECIHVNGLLSQEALDMPTLKMAKVNFEKVWSAVVETFHEIEILSGGLIELKIQEKFESAERKAMELLNTLSIEIRQLAQETRSNLSRVSHGSKASQLAAEAAAELAEKKTKLKYLKLEAEQKAKLAQLEAEKELAIAQAKVDALSNVSRGGDIAAHDLPDLPEVDKKVLVDKYLHNNPHVDTSDSVVHTLCNHLTLSRLPVPEPGVFSGDPLLYPSWKKSFETLVASRAIPPDERLHYLKKYLGGEAKSCIEGFFFLATPDAYDAAWNLLDKRFGSSFSVAKAFHSKLDQWPRIPYRDGKGLQKFVDFLRQCETAMQTIPSMRYLNHEFEHQKILAKLPGDVAKSWAKEATRKEEMPSFSEFVKFLVKESDRVNHPIFSFRSWNNEEKDSKSNSKPKAHTNTVNTKRYKCFFCKGDHATRLCKDLVKKSEDEKRKFVYEHSLCWRCLRGKHLSKDCQSNFTCDTCKGKHATVLHGIQMVPQNDSKLRQPNRFSRQRSQTSSQPVARQGSSSGSNQSSLRPEASSFSPNVVSSGSSVVNSSLAKPSAHSGATCLSSYTEGRLSSMIVPVYVSHEDFPHNERLVYALLDSQSDTSFILNKTCEALKVRGDQTELSLSTMFAEDKSVQCNKVNGLMVRSYDSDVRINLPPVFSRSIMPANRSHIPTPQMTCNWPYLQQINDKLMPISDCEIGLLIGYNCPRALMPRQVIPSQNGGPYAQQTDLGWGIIGVIDHDHIAGDPIGHSHRILAYEVQGSNRSVQVSFNVHTKEVVSARDVLNVLEADFNDSSQGVGLSKDDKSFLNIMQSNIKQNDDGHYEMPLPFRQSKPNLVNNRFQAEKRLEHLKSKFNKDSDYKSDYVSFMSEMLRDGYAEPVPEDEIDNSNAWYIPHHGVYNTQKRKLRVVFDCSAKYIGRSLNDCLLPGPDLTNSLLGVLCRFREEDIAFICDITKMFYQFRVSPHQRDYLRFLWWRDGDILKPPTVYRMTVHIFGATSSPSCSNFGLKQVASDYEHEFGSDVGDFLRLNFYVDDGLKSVKSESVAVDLIKRTRQLCAKGKLKLHKFVSNSRTVLESVPIEDRSGVVQSVNLKFEDLPVERALGIVWCVESDVFQFRVIVRDRPYTRRGLLATVASIYDPLGYIAPFTLLGKRILQQLCIDGLGWDDAISDDLRAKWEKWLRDILELQNIDIKRCVKPSDFVVQKAEFHHFCDASFLGYGVCSYLRLISTEGDVHVSLVLGKSRVTPIKPITVPRLELTSAVVAVKAALTLSQEFTYKKAEHFFWTDSKVVLGYIANETKRFHLFVANRVGYIHANTDRNQWNYVPGSQNVADIASRGSTAKELKESRWFAGPEFLWSSQLSVFQTSDPTICESDAEVKKAKVLATSSTKKFELDRFVHCSSWQRLKKAVALCLLLKKWLKSKVSNQPFPTPQMVTRQNKLSLYETVSTNDLREAELEILKHVQSNAFAGELSRLREGSSDTVSSSSPLFKLNCFVDTDGLVRVGGRLAKANLSSNERNPIVLPKEGHITHLLVRFCHEKVVHQGRGMTLNELRSRGFWILKGSSVVSRYIHSCVVCRRVRASLGSQKMSDLPSDRLEPSPPFTFCAVDYFGPFLIKENRKEVKRWGVLYTCLCSRAVHLEVANSLSTSSFINSLRRFIAMRGPIAVLRSDQGTNFAGARKQLKEALREIDNEKVREFLLENNCSFSFKMNPPAASHMGGVWERMIRSVRSILDVILSQHGSQLDDESLRTYMCEIAAILNCRPLSTEHINDPSYPEPLTPNHILTMKSKIVVSPPGDFQQDDVYSVKRWRRVQYLVDQFWSRWQKEYLNQIQSRSKWQRTRRNFCVGDVVVLKDECLSRNMWKLGRVVEVYVSDDSLVRSVKVIVGDSNLDKRGRRVSQPSYLVRPIHKLVLLLENES